MPFLPVLHQQQRQQSDCLVACAAMVLRYLEIPYTYDRLLRLLRTEAHGTIFSHLYSLESLGVFVELGKGEFAKLNNYLDVGLPVIVAVETAMLTYWRDATSHAVVVVGIEGQVVYVNDPAFELAPQVITWNEFAAAWTEMDSQYGVIGLAHF